MAAQDTPCRAVGTGGERGIPLPQILAYKLTLSQSEGEGEIMPTTYLLTLLDFLILLRPCHAIKSALRVSQ